MKLERSHGFSPFELIFRILVICVVIALICLVLRHFTGRPHF